MIPYTEGLDDVLDKEDTAWTMADSCKDRDPSEKKRLNTFLKAARTSGCGQCTSSLPLAPPWSSLVQDV